MKRFKELLKKSKDLCGQLMSSMFDSNNSVTVVEELLESAEKSSKTFEGCKATENLTPLSDAPNIDYYMDSQNVKDKEGENEIAKGQDNECKNEKELYTDFVEEANLDENCNKQLMYELPTLLEELNKLCSQTTDENVISTIQFCESRIVEIMLSCGCESINEDSSFDNSRHVPQPFSFVQNGCMIEKTIKPGLSYKNKVLVKAIVKCKQ